MKRKKILAGLLAVLMIGQTAGSVSALTSETSDAESLTFNNEGLCFNF